MEDNNEYKQEIKSMKEIPTDLKEKFIEFVNEYTSIKYESFTNDW